MRILQKLVLDCDPDAAWRALHSPAVFAELYGPLLSVRALGAEAIPAVWEPGRDAAVRIDAGPVPLGTQLIATADRTKDDGRVRILRDTGTPLTGPLATLDVWDHQMAVSAAPGDPSRTLWRERLTIGGPTALALWPVLWAIWQLRAARLRRLARHWAFDPGA
ncbi:hypothetical protein N8K70_13685 [Microbacterium betulae]|uniref:Uncharacterized protein n=1 Tax=Microbacterium betulae TaxID=2981139 RepID=A0AA97FF87_9MICO|nr:hypothetical protein [Microbacterium sp. AB]WOF22431.1 hypothetical protein N8K70_13685 [Microbacterium sp. AB]